MIATVLLGVALSAPASLPACEYEDGSSQAICVWDGRHQGNGEGSSVLIINGGEDNMKVVRISHRLAHRLTH
jgi:hypothetical protein